MSGFQGTNTTEGGNGFADIVLSPGIGSVLTKLLLAEEIVPGQPASYEICKAIYSYHALGAKLAEVPISLAQSQERDITIPRGPETVLLPAFKREWLATGNGIGADTLIANVMRTARIYGIASLVAGDRSGKQSDPLQLDKLHETDLYYNVMDPLNTSGSLVLDQNPNSPDFQKPKAITVSGTTYHPSRSVIIMNEQPLYIEWSNSAFGFVGRSVYQRALYPLKTFLQTMITDQWVTQKVGLLIAKQKAPGSIVNNRIMQFFGWKRTQLKAGLTGNVLTIGTEEEVASLNFQNLEGPAKFARDNALKNIAMAAGMPAKLLEQEAMVGGMAEGTEDAKQIARFIDRIRIDMAPLYTFFDRIVQRRAWSPEFYEGVKKEIPEYRRVPYETAFYQWTNSFQAVWPNLLAEPESEKVKVEETRFKSVTALVEVLSPLLDPENKASLVDWAAEEINSRRELFSSALTLNIDALKNYVPPTSEFGADEDQEPHAKPFAAAA